MTSLETAPPLDNGPSGGGLRGNSPGIAAFPIFLLAMVAIVMQFEKKNVFFEKKHVFFAKKIGFQKKNTLFFLNTHLKEITS